ncbi:MAG: hypothetical protein ACP5D6_06490 [Kosmotogaceae bacterium]
MKGKHMDTRGKPKDDISYTWRHRYKINIEGKYTKVKLPIYRIVAKIVVLLGKIITKNENMYEYELEIFNLTFIYTHFKVNSMIGHDEEKSYLHIFISDLIFDLARLL